MKNPSISIVLVNYNGYDDTIECIKSLMQIEYDNYKVIVVDNGSTSKPDRRTLHFIQQNSIYIRLNDNLGFSGGNNIGIDLAIKDGADYILLLNNDTVVTSSFLNILVAEAMTRNNKAIVTGKIYYFSKPNEIWYGGGWYDYNRGIGCHERNHTIDDFSKASKSRNISFATGCMMLIPANVIKEIGMLEESFFLYAEDTEYCLRALQSGFEIVFCENAIIYHKVSCSTTRMSTPTLYYLIRNSIRVAKKYSHSKTGALLYWAVFCVKRAIKKELPFSIGVRAYVAGLKDEKGPI